MALNNLYVSHRSVWYHDQEELIDRIMTKMDEQRFVKTWDQKTEIRSLISEELEDYTLYRSNNNEKKGVLWWRFLYFLIAIFQWLLWPYCLYRWFTTGNFKIDSKSRLGMFIDRVVEKAIR